MGRPGRGPRRSANAGWARRAAPAVSGGLSNQADGPPHRGAYGLNATPAAPVALAAQGPAVCAVSPHAPASAEPGGQGLRTAEQTGRQALEQAAPPPCPGRQAWPSGLRRPLCATGRRV